MQTKRHTQGSTPRTVLLGLSRGTSTHVSWLLRCSPNAATVTIGSATSCDWQVLAPGVAPHALSVALFDGGLFVASGPGAEAMLEGSPLPEVWQRVDRTLSIGIGSAQIELVWEEAEDQRRIWSERDRPTFPDGFCSGDDDERTKASTLAARTSWVDRFSRSSLLDTPSLLGRVAESRRSSQRLRYMGLFLFTALAYRAWLLLLDRI